MDLPLIFRILQYVWSMAQITLQVIQRTTKNWLGPWLNVLACLIYGMEFPLVLDLYFEFRIQLVMEFKHQLQLAHCFGSMGSFIIERICITKQGQPMPMLNGQKSIGCYEKKSFQSVTFQFIMRFNGLPSFHRVLRINVVSSAPNVLKLPEEYINPISLYWYYLQRENRF